MTGQLYAGETGDNSNGDEPGHLLAVDILKLAQGDGYVGTLAASVEQYGGCTYRIVRDGVARFGAGVAEDRINVHVSS